MKNICAPLLNSFDWKRPLAGILFSLLAIPSHAGDEARHEFLLFPSVELFNNTGLDDELFDSAGYFGIADFMYSYSGNRLRFLGEYVLLRVVHKERALGCGLCGRYSCGTG